MVLDAGSSVRIHNCIVGRVSRLTGVKGTRLYVYRWLKNSYARESLKDVELQSLPDIRTKKKWTQKTKPGISTFGGHPERIGPDHLRDLFENAKSIVPKHATEETPIFLMATAGMRLLPPQQRVAILKSVCEYAQSTTKFLITDCDLQFKVISGDTEGLYGWIAANYLLGGFDPQIENTGADHRTFGFLDMGGASAQIAFAPNSTEAQRHANDLTLVRMRNVNGDAMEHRVFSTTWLRFGVHEARSRYVEALEKSKETAGAKQLLDPCLPDGLTLTPAGDIFLPDDKTIDGKSLLLKGTGNFEECLKRTQPLLGKDLECEDDPCPVAGVHVPAIDFDVNHFVGVSEYWHTTHEIFQLDEPDKSYDLNTYQQRVHKFCSQNWHQIEIGLKEGKWGHKVDETRAAEACFKASWLLNLLHEGIGVPRIGLEKTPDINHNSTTKLLEAAKTKGFAENFRPINKINDTEVSWTLGKIVLYASSEIPSSVDNSLPVGFGSNVLGVPSDFQYPGTRSDLTPVAGNLSQSTPHDSPALQQQVLSPLSSKGSRRIPGIVIFLVLISLILYWLLNRTRRNHLSTSVLSKGSRLNHTGRRHFLAKTLFSLFPSTSHTKYEPVDLEDGDLNAPDTFELGGYLDEEGSSDSSNGSKAAAKSSGWSTPRTRSGANLGEHTPSGFDGLGSGPGLGIGLVGTAMARSGLVERVESREHLSSLAETERKSRSGSPARRSASRLGRLIED